MEPEITRFFSEQVPVLIRALDGFDRRINPEATPESALIVDELTRSINSSLANCAELEAWLAVTDPRMLKEVQTGYREAIWPWFGKSWFMNQALNKPRGYPGDYQMLTAIYDGVPKLRGLGGYLDRYFLNTALGRAVPARLRLARRFLLDELARRSGKVSVLNVACGPCREYLGGLGPTRDGQVTIALIDNDPLALDYVQAQVVPAVEGGVKLNFIRYNALRMSSAALNVERFGRSDIIYSVGLCDYIPDKYLVPMLKGWRGSLNEGGIVYVAFKDAMRYHKTEYQWLVDWFFLHATEEQCRRLFEEAGYDMGDLESVRDETGVIINFIARNKVRTSYLRADLAEPWPHSPHVGAKAEPNENRTSEPA